MVEDGKPEESGVDNDNMPDWVEDVDRRNVLKGAGATLPVLAAGCLGGGNGGGNGGGGGGGENEVHVLTDYNNSRWQTMWEETVLPEFEENNPDTPVNLEYTGTHGSGEQRLATLLQSGDPPETFTTSLAQVGDILMDDGFASVDDTWDAIEEGQGTDTLYRDTASAGGDTLVVPHGVYTSTYMYRSDLFDQLGIETPPDENIIENPWTWEDRLAAAEAIDNDKDIEARGSTVSAHMESGAAALAWDAGINGAGGGQFRWMSDDREEAEVWMDPDHHIPALENYQQLAEFSPDPSSIDYETMFGWWASNRISQTQIVNAWPLQATLEANEEIAFNTDVTLTPKMSGAEPVDYGTASIDGHTVFEAADSKEGMKSLLEQMYGTPDKAAKKSLVEPMRFISPYPAAIETDTYANADIMQAGDGHFLNIQRKITNEIVPHLNNPERPTTQTAPLIYAGTIAQGREAMNRLLVQGMTPQKVHEATVEKTEEALAEGKERAS